MLLKPLGLILVRLKLKKAITKVQFLLFFSVIFWVNSVFAHSEKTKIEKNEESSLCGVVEDRVGQVQSLSADRSRFSDIVPKKGITCGSWISVIQGWVRIRHSGGAIIQLGPESFAQFIDPHNDAEFKGDQLIFYRGQILAEVANGSTELKVVSPVARARVKNGKVLFYSRLSDDEAQLIALKNTATLENRFSPRPKIVVKAGEATSLNLKLQRVIPTLPKAVSVASLKPMLYVFKLDENERSEILELARKRQSRKFASDFATLNEKSESKGQRGLASTKTGSDYRRHEPSELEPVLYEHWVNRMVSGDRTGEKILFPNKIQDVSQKMRLMVSDPEETSKKKIQKVELEEKKRLIEELSRIRIE